MRVLIVSPHFPPVNAPDMQRVRMSLPAFVAAGWDVTVLTVADPSPTAPVESELLAMVPEEVEIVRAFCLSRKWTARLGVNNVALRSLPFLFLNGCWQLFSKRYDVVYFSTTMFITLPLGRLWKMLFRVPYVIDLQDPWVSDFYDRPGAPRPPGGWKYRIADATGRLLEGWTMRGAARLISVSAAYLDTLRVRYPEIVRVPGIELPFGSPDPDLALLKKTLRERSILPAGGIRLAFAGAIGPGMLPAVDLLFAAMAEMKNSGIALSAHFFGTSYSPRSTGVPATPELAERHGVQASVYEQTDRLGYLDSLRVTLEAGVNLLFGSTDLEFVPSKLMTVLAAGRPVLAIAPRGSVVVTRLASLGLGCIVFSPGELTQSLIQETVARLGEFSRETPSVSLSTAQWSAAAVAAGQLQELSAASAALEIHTP